MAEADRISNLPADITNLILTYLPTREAVRTSILSKGWRYRWTTIPNLVFDKNCCPASCDDKALTGNKIVSLVNRALSLHTGPMQVLKILEIPSVPDIDGWVLRASRSSVKELVLDLLDTENELPSSLYACNSLIRLELIYCALKPPPAFKGFENLRTLDLMLVPLTDDAFESLVSGCPLLERLTMNSFDDFNNLKINAPNLRSLDIDCALDNIVFGDVHVNLLDVCIHIKLNHRTKQRVDVESLLAQFFIKLPGVERLVVQRDFLKYLGLGPIPERLPTQCSSLHHLSIRIDLSSVRGSWVALCIFRSSPNLTELEIKGAFDALSLGRSNWLDENKCGCALDKLRTVKISGLQGFREELDFIEFVLMNSPALEKMYVIGYSLDRIDFVVQEMPRFRKASTQAEIVFETML